MNTQDHEVHDRDGKRVRRDGVLQDGDRMVVKMNMMDGADPALAALASAAALADAVKRNEAFDARGHRPGYGTHSTASTSARDQYHARTLDAWRNPPPVIDDTKDHKPEAATTVLPTSPNELFAARDKAVSDRDTRLEAAWQQP
jgi:hypothetical protein